MSKIITKKQLLGMVSHLDDNQEINLGVWDGEDTWFVKRLDLNDESSVGAVDMSMELTAGYKVVRSCGIPDQEQINDAHSWMESRGYDVNLDDKGKLFLSMEDGNDIYVSDAEIINRATEYFNEPFDDNEFDDATEDED